MSDIFREVDEEIRRDRASELWAKHSSKLIAAAVLFVAAVAGWQYYKTYEFSARAALGAAYENALGDAQADKADAIAGLTTLASQKSGIYPALARFRLAGELARKASDDASRVNAISAFDALSNDATLPVEWRDLARLRAGFILVETAPLADVEARLSPLVSATGVFRHSAREGIALAAWRSGALEKALDALQAIILDADTPSGLRQRAELLLAVVRAGPSAKP